MAEILNKEEKQQAFGIDRHDPIIMDNSKRIKAEKIAEEDLSGQYRGLDELRNRWGAFDRWISLSLDKEQGTVRAVVTDIKTRDVLKEYNLPLPKHQCGGKGILKKVSVLDHKNKEITQFQICCNNCKDGTGISSESGAIDNWVAMTIGVKIWEND